MTFCVTALCMICNNRARSVKHTSRARNKGMRQSDTDIKNKVFVICSLVCCYSTSVRFNSQISKCRPIIASLFARKWWLKQTCCCKPTPKSSPHSEDHNQTVQCVGLQLYQRNTNCTAHWFIDQGNWLLHVYSSTVHTHLIQYNETCPHCISLASKLKSCFCRVSSVLSS